MEDERGLRAVAQWLYACGYPYDFPAMDPPPRDVIPWLVAYWNEEWQIEWKDAKRQVIAGIRGEA